MFLTRAQAKHIKSLRQKKRRYEHQQFVVEGETIVDEILKSIPGTLQQIVCTDQYRSTLSSDVLANLGDRLVDCDQKTLDSISSLETATPVLALLSMPQGDSSPAFDTGLGIYLDGIRDPGNLGTILRIADWFGLRTVALSDDCVDVYNAKTIQASMGAFLRVNSRTMSIEQVIQSNPQLSILGTCIDSGQNAFAFQWPKDAILVIGSESHGIHPDNHRLISQWISIPRGGSQSGAESLNAGVAAGILAAQYFAVHSIAKK